MNGKDLKIIVELRKNARARLTEISKKTHIPISTIYDRLVNRDLKVQKYACLLDFEKFGFNTRAQLCLKCGKSSKKDILNFLVTHQNVNSLHKINNGYDYMAELIFRNVKNLEEFIEHLDDKFVIKTKQVYYIIEDIQKEKFLTDEIHLDLLEE